MKASTIVLLVGLCMGSFSGCRGYGIYEDVEAVPDPVQQVHQTFYRKPNFQPKGLKVAILDFKGNGSGQGQAFADILATNLFTTGFQVVERQNIGTLMQEFRLAREGNKDLTDTQIIQKIGRMADVDIVIVGGIVEYSEKLGQANHTGGSSDNE
jgi:curli biogenesis system outer membrane secretion channel CsgG